jgi:hypothetical protein
VWQAHDLAEVLVPGPENPNDEGRGQEIEIPASGGIADAQRPAELGRVPDLTVP